MSHDIDGNLFEQIFGHTLIKLADKLINTTNKEENQIIIKNIEKNKFEILKRDKFNNFLIQPYSQRAKLKESIDLILNLNEELNQIWFECNSIENMKIKKCVSSF